MPKNLLQLLNQLRDIWKQLGLNQKVSVIAASFVVLAGLAAIAFWSNRTDYTLLYAHMDDSEAAKVITALQESKTPYQTGSGGSIYVPANKVHSLRMQLAGKGIGKGDVVGFEIFDRPNFGISDFAQRANYLRAIQGELSRTISQLNEVDGAKVMIVMPENKLLVDNQKHPTASVFVKVKGNNQLDAQAVNSIRFMVANAVEGLQANYVTVVDNRGRVLSENSEPDSIAGLGATQLSILKAREKYLAQKAEEMLIPVVGPGGAVVRVSTEINFDTRNTTTEDYDPESQVARNETTEDNTMTSASSSASTGSGMAANANMDAPTNTVASAGPQTTSQTKKKSITKTYDVSKTTTTFQKTPGDLKRISVAVLLAMKVEGTGADRKLVPRNEDELKSIKNMVQSALGVQLTNNTERVDEITLLEAPFNETATIELNKQLDQQQKQLFYTDLIRNIAYPALALVILFIFFRAFKKTAPENLPVGIPLSQMSSGGNGNGSRTGGNNVAAPEPGIVTVDVLNRLVRENPDNMNQAIRTWLTRGQKPGAKN